MVRNVWSLKIARIYMNFMLFCGYGSPERTYWTHLVVNDTLRISHLRPRDQYPDEGVVVGSRAGYGIVERLGKEARLILNSLNWNNQTSINIVFPHRGSIQERSNSPLTMPASTLSMQWRH